jgi:integrase
VRGGFATRDDAERVLDRILGDLAQGRTGLPGDPRRGPRLGDLAPDFLARRKLTHRAGAEDGYRWRKHLGPTFDRLRPGEVDAGRIRAFVEAKLAAGLNPGTIRIFVAILSALFTDLVERGIAASNPTRNLPRSTMRLMRPTHDPRTTPFIERLSDVRRIYLTLPEPFHVAYAIGARAGLRTGEVFALRWEHVDLERRRIHVRESVKGPLKDKDSRVVPVLNPLVPILTEWRLKTGGRGRVVPPLRRDGTKVDKHTPGEYLREALDHLGLTRPGLRWYQATRHTFASQWVMSGGSIEKLKELLGHYSVIMTERYAHLRPDLFTARDLATIEVDLSAGEPDSLPFRPEIGHRMGTSPLTPTRNQLKENRKCRSRPVSRGLFHLSLAVRARRQVPSIRVLPRPVGGAKAVPRGRWRRRMASHRPVRCTARMGPERAIPLPEACLGHGPRRPRARGGARAPGDRWCRFRGSTSAGDDRSPKVKVPLLRHSVPTLYPPLAQGRLRSRGPLDVRRMTRPGLRCRSP